MKDYYNNLKIEVKDLKLAAEQEVLKKEVEEAQIKVEDKLSAAKTSIELMVEAYNAVIKEGGDNNAKEQKFIEELKKGLSISEASPEGFDDSAKEGFNAIYSQYSGKPVDDNLKFLISDPTGWDKFKDILGWVTNIAPKRIRQPLRIQASKRWLKRKEHNLLQERYKSNRQHLSHKVYCEKKWINFSLQPQYIT